MALSEGGREILEAARKRLATAKSQATAAKQMLVHAQSMYDAAEKERKDAQTALDEAEKKYEVIDIDDEPETPTAEGSNKVSLSPQSQSNNNNNIVALPNNETSTTRNNTIPTSIAFTSSSSNATNNYLSNNSNMGFDRVVVSACGYPGVGGTYKQENGSLYEGAPVFTKQVGSTTFAIYRVPSNQKYWYIGHWNRNTNSEMPSRLFKSICT